LVNIWRELAATFLRITLYSVQLAASHSNNRGGSRDPDFGQAPNFYEFQLQPAGGYCFGARATWVCPSVRIWFCTSAEVLYLPGTAPQIVRSTSDKEVCRTTTSLTLKGQRSRSRSRSRSRTRKCRNRFFGRSSVKNCPIDFGKDQNVPRSKYCHALSVTNGQSCVDHAHVTDS